LVCHIILYIVYVIPTLFFIKTTDETYKVLAPFLSNADEWFQKISLMFIPASPYVDDYFYALMVGIGYTAIGSLGIYVFYSFRFFKTLKKGSKKTRRMQITLFKAITVQILLALVLLQLPALAIPFLYK
jgi:hypothetical protein